MMGIYEMSVLMMKLILYRECFGDGVVCACCGSSYQEPCLCTTGMGVSCPVYALEQVMSCFTTRGMPVPPGCTYSLLQSI